MKGESMLKGAAALVTGGARRLGAACVRLLAEEGTNVCIHYRTSGEEAEALAAEVRDSGVKAETVRGDLSDPRGIEKLFEEVLGAVGPIDILINNSGVSTTRRLVDVTEKDFDFTFDTNVKGAFFVAQAVARRMIERARASAEAPAMPRGRIVNIASVAGLRVLAQIGVYCMSKAAVVQMTKAMALEWGRFGINVNAICPGYIDTEINHHHWQTEQGQKLISMLPRKRVGEPKDLDAVLMMLASDQSHFVNGAVIAADDGFAV